MGVRTRATMRACLAPTILVVIAHSSATTSSPSAGNVAGSAIVAQVRLVPNPAGAVLSTSRASWCLASHLRISASWLGVNTTKIGGVMLSPRGIAPCTVRGRPRIELFADGYRLDVRQKPGAPLGNRLDEIERTITVRSGHPAGFAFDWVNWCGGGSQGPIMLRVILPTGGGRISTFVRYGTIQRSSDGPACLAPAQPSTMYVGFIRSVTPGTPLPWSHVRSDNHPVLRCRMWTGVMVAIGCVGVTNRVVARLYMMSAARNPLKRSAPNCCAF